MNAYISLRKAALSDCPLLADMNKQLIEDEGHRNPMTVSKLEERMRGWLESGYQAFLFIGPNAEVLGYALFRDEAEWVYLRQFYVDRRWRRKKIGTAAFSAIEEQIGMKKDRLRLDVLTKNKGGIAFWQSLGFEEYCLTLEKTVGSRP